MSSTRAAAGSAPDRSHLVRGARRAPVRARRRPVLGLLVALALGAGVAVWLIVAALPGGARADDRDGPTGGGASASASVELVGPATVVASSSCVGEDPRDTVAVDGPAGRRLVPLDGCGSPMGARMTVRVAFVGGEPADAPARVLGTGSSAALTTGDSAGSPLTGRLAILLTGVAGLGMAGLLVAVVHERRRRAAAVSARRPARTVTTTARPAAPARRRNAERRDEPARSAGEPARTHRPAARPARAARAGRPAALDAGRRLPAQRNGASRTPGNGSAGKGAASRGTGKGSARGTRRPAAGPYRG